MIAEIIFFVCIILIIYTYLGYPLLLMLITLFYKKPVKKADITPSVSIIISAYNEEKTIKKTIKNVLALDYPKNKREIIIVSDGSTDRTEEIIKRYIKNGIKLTSLDKNLGKTNAQNIAVKKTKGKILVFMDAGTLYKKEVLRKLIRNFADEKIGGVTGIEQTTGQRKSYLNFEEFIRSKESQIFSVFCVNGCLYAVRKDLYKEIDKRLASDFIIASKIIDQDFRFVHDKEAIAFEKSNKELNKEFNMRVRIAERTWAGFISLRKLFNSFKFGFISFELFSHKLLRYLVPFFMILIFVTNIVLINESIGYLLMLDMQILFYLFAVVGLEIKPLRIFSYFVMSNIAISNGLFKFISGDEFVSWVPMR